MNRRWLVKRNNPEFIRHLSKSASVSTILAQILVNRGIKSARDAADFLAPGIRGLADPFGLPGMQTAMTRIRSAVSEGRPVLVHGDYDADGLTAAAIMVHALTAAGINTHYFIPNRMTHGYGFNPEAVDLARRLGAGLIVTVDCGITSFDAADSARRAGIDLIITDHHEPLRKAGNGAEGPSDAGAFILPPALAVIDPKLAECTELLNLSGAGIAFKFAQAMALQDDIPLSSEEALSLLDLAALGTLADVVSLTGENRSILKEGLKLIGRGRRAGIRALRSVCGLDARAAKSGLLAYTVVPRINAAGRIDDPRDVVRLLLTEEDDEASALSRWLDGLNSERQRIEEGVYREAVSRLEAPHDQPVIVLWGEGWHQGVLGIVAARIAEEFCRPTFIFSVEGGIAKGSARSIPAFNVCSGLAKCSDMLLSFGGHSQAAGVRLAVEQIGDFREKMGDLARADAGRGPAVPAIEIDVDVTLGNITHPLMSEMELLEPYGHGNEEPLFGAKNLAVLNSRAVGRNHLKAKLKDNFQAVDAIGFGLGRAYEELGRPSRIDAVFTPAVNDWNGGRSLQLVLKAFRPAG